MAEGVVDLLEAIEVDEQQRAAPAFQGAALDQVGEPALEQRAIGKAGQGVGVGELLELALGLLALGDVLHGADDADDLVVGDLGLADHRKIASRAVRVQHAQVGGLGPAAAQDPFLHLPEAVGVAVQEIGPHVLNGRLERVGLEAEKLVELGRPDRAADVQPVAPGADLAEPVGFLQRPRALVEQRLGRPELGDVAGRAAIAEKAAVIGEDGLAAGADADARSVLADQRIGEVAKRAVGLHVGPVPRHGLRVFGRISQFPACLPASGHRLEGRIAGKRLGIGQQPMGGVALPAPVRGSADEIGQPLLALRQAPQRGSPLRDVADNAGYAPDLTVRVELRLAMHHAVEQAAIGSEERRLHRIGLPLRPAGRVMRLQNLPAFRQIALAHRGDGDEAVGRLEFVEGSELRRYPEIGRGGTLRFPVAHAGQPDGTPQRPLFVPTPTRYPRGGLPLRQFASGHRSPTKMPNYNYAANSLAYRATILQRRRSQPGVLPVLWCSFCESCNRHQVCGRNPIWMKLLSRLSSGCVGSRFYPAAPTNLSGRILHHQKFSPRPSREILHLMVWSLVPMERLGIPLRSKTHWFCVVKSNA